MGDVLCKPVVKVHLEAKFRNDQNDDDVFELYFGHDPFWLNEEEMVEFRDTLDAMLAAHRIATSSLEADG